MNHTLKYRNKSKMICRILALNLTQSGFIHTTPELLLRRGLNVIQTGYHAFMQASHLRFYFPFCFLQKFISYMNFVGVNLNLNVDKGLI